jgi:hypothetical protein
MTLIRASLMETSVGKANVAQWRVGFFVSGRRTWAELLPYCRQHRSSEYQREVSVFSRRFGKVLVYAEKRLV